MFESLKESNLDNVPFNVLTELTQAATQASQSFQQIKDFDPSGQNNPAGVRDGLIKQIDDQYQQYFKQVSPVVAYSVRKGTDFERLESDARLALDEIRKVSADIQSQGRKIVSDANDALEQVKQAAAEVGVAQHAVHFKEEAAAHLKNSRYWLGATGLLGAATAVYGFWSLSYYARLTKEMSTAQSVQLGVSKLIVFSILYFAAVWAGRTYRAQLHNHVINKHRQNALSTFETFVKAAGDDQTKNAVLMQATQAIFMPQASGFVTSDNEVAASPQILEIVRSVAGVRTPPTQ